MSSTMFKVYVVTKGKDNNKTFWNEIGVAWSFETKKAGRGLTVKLHALPIGGEMVIVKPGEKKEPENDGSPF